MSSITPAYPDQPVLSGECVAYQTPEGKDLACLIHHIDREARWIVDHPYDLADPASMTFGRFLVVHDTHFTRRWFLAHVDPGPEQ